MINLSYDKAVGTVIPVERGLQIVVAAWDLFESHGWAGRSNREVVSEPIFSEGCMPTDGSDAVLPQKMVPSLYEVCAWNAYASSTAEWHDDNPFKLVITGDVVTRAEGVRDAVIGDNVLRILSEQGNDFQKRIGEILAKTSMKVSELKSLAYVVPMAADIERKGKMDLMLDGASREHLGSVGTKIDVVASIMAVRFSREYSIWNHTAITEGGHVVSFFNKTKHEEGTRLRLTANVKDHRSMYKRPDVPETRLNYVKILDRPAR